MYLPDETIERFAIRAAKGNNGGEWAMHYTEEQKEYWRQFVRDMAEVVMHAVPATQAQVDMVLNADQTSNDGRSNWLVITLLNGDVVFGCYPEGNTFDMLINGRR